MSSPSHKIEKRQTIQNRERVLETEERERVEADLQR